jgi:aspartyl aminopeptidase
MKHLTLFFLLIFSLNSCQWESEEKLFPPDDSCDTTAISYSNDVAPIINNNCSSCHSQQNANTLGSGIVLTEYNNLKNRIQTVVGAINHNSGFSQMPKNASKLTDCQIDIIEKWLDAGMPNN